MHFWRDINDRFHRIKGPAIVHSNGDEEWWLEGVRHRTNGPAKEFDNGNKEWWIKNQRHRTDGPAIDYVDWYKAWWIHGELHRIDGPAVVYVNGDENIWSLCGETFTKDGFINRVAQGDLKTLLISRVVNHYCPIAISGYGW